LLIISLWSIVDTRSPSPFDVRIDHHKVETARDLIINTPRPRFSWKIRVLDNISQRNIQQIAYQIQLQSIVLTQRDNYFQWDSERVVSSQSTHVPYTGHADLLPSKYYCFRLRVWITDTEEPSEWTTWIQFRTPVFNLHEYITKNVDLIWIGSTQINMNELRKEFLVPNTSPVKSAIVYISGLGYYEFYLNGNNVDPSRKLDPGWTTYEKRTLLASFDVTANITVRHVFFFLCKDDLFVFVQTGMNAVGVKLGNGWYSPEQQGERSYGKQKFSFFFTGKFSFLILGPPRLVFTLSITFKNGDEMQVLSDQTWIGREGSIKHDSVYNGEIFDSRNDRLDWARPRFNDSLSAWIMPESLPSPINGSSTGIIVLQDMPPIRSGLDALHFEVTIDGQQQGYLNAEDVGEIKGASLTDGAVLKPVAMWNSESGMFSID
jgi:alpha-L-rhamnosidase